MTTSYFRMTDLERIACEIAMVVPEQIRNGSAYVQADVIGALRAELDKRNFDWRDARKRLLELRERDNSRPRPEARA